MREAWLMRGFLAGDIEQIRTATPGGSLQEWQLWRGFSVKPGEVAIDEGIAICGETNPIFSTERLQRSAPIKSNKLRSHLQMQTAVRWI